MKEKTKYIIFNYLRYFTILLGATINLNTNAVAADRTLIIGVEDTRYYPHYAVVDGSWEGFASDLLARFASDLQYDIQIVPMPVERLFRSFFLNEIDFKYPSSPDWKKDQKHKLDISYSDRVVDYIDGASVLTENVGNEIKSLGLPRGFTPVAWQNRIDSGATVLVKADGFQSLVLQALKGRVDAIYANTDVVRYQAQELVLEYDIDNATLVFDRSQPYDKGVYRLATRKHPDIIDEFNQWMLSNAETIERLKNDYFEETKSK